VAVVGTDVVAPPGKKFGSFTRPVVRFGKPLDFERYDGLENDRYILRSITDEIMYEIMRLSGQEYVDMYATRAKEEAKKAEVAARAAQRVADAAAEEARAAAEPAIADAPAGPETKAS
jgi:1-acyl-sn-glycerol-3-phosphate acyltransferase